MSSVIANSAPSPITFPKAPSAAIQKPPRFTIRPCSVIWRSEKFEYCHSKEHDEEERSCRIGLIRWVCSEDLISKMQEEKRSDLQKYATRTGHDKWPGLEWTKLRLCLELIPFCLWTSPAFSTTTI